MIGIIGLVLAIVISYLWYRPGLKALGTAQVLTKNDLLRIALQYGLLVSCLLIIITEILWDIFFGKAFTGLAQDILSDFLRAALLEEIFKFLGFMLAKKRFQLSRKIDYILTAGMMGLVYSVVEKAVLGNIGSIFVGLAIPMHIMWQFNQGAHYYEYEQKKAAGDQAGARREWILAIPFIFVFHGCWDSLLDVAGFLINKEKTALEIVGGVLFLLLVVLGVMYCVKTVKKVVAIAKEEAAKTEA